MWPLGCSRLFSDCVHVAHIWPVLDRLKMESPAVVHTQFLFRGIIGQMWSSVAKIFKNLKFREFGGYNFEQAKINFEVNTGGQISIVLH